MKVGELFGKCRSSIGGICQAKIYLAPNGQMVSSFTERDFYDRKECFQKYANSEVNGWGVKGKTLLIDIKVEE